MKWRGTHLTYCLSIHPGETWEENYEAIRTQATAVKRRVCPNAEFGLGLRLSALAANELAGHIGELMRYLEGTGMYVFTINGFPYGRFHGARVKEKVYLPGWASPQRLEYTVRLARLLAALLPEGVDGTISTVPIGYGSKIPEKALANLVSAARELAQIRDQTGANVLLALEPEPDCAIATSEDAVRFFERLNRRGDEAVSRHLGICLDTCHMVCEFETPAAALERIEAAGIRVPKVQVSSALIVPEGGRARELLRPFAEEVYLHQTAVRSKGKIARFPDLDRALVEAPEGEWRVHFHVPLDFPARSELRSSSHLLDKAFFGAALTPSRHVEIETYSFNVLSGPRRDVVDSVVGEFEWLMQAASGTDE